MRVMIGLLVAAVLGTSLGLGFAVWRVGLPIETPALAAPKVEGEQPVASLDKELHNFGPVLATSEQNHAFVVTNQGNAPLRLTTRPEDSSCRCTVGAIEKNVLMPGESGKVIVTWHGKGHVHPFRETAVLRTNDPRRPRIELMVSGRSVHMVVPYPQQLRLTTAPGRETSGQIRIYGYDKNRPLEISNLKLDKSEFDQYMAYEMSPLSSEELAKEEAYSGLLLNITLKPGLGNSTHEVKLLADHNLGQEPLTVPLVLDVIQDLSLVSTSWDKQRHILYLGQVTPGHSQTVDLYVRGEHRQNFKVEVESIEPPYLDVEVGQPSNLGEFITKFPLRILVKPDAPAEARLGGDQGEHGTIVLKTSHPRESEFRINLAFSVKKADKAE